MSNHESSSDPSGARVESPGGGSVEAVAAAPRRGGRRRLLLPVAIATTAVAAVAAVPALAAGSDLPSITAQQLLTKALTSHVQTFSGTVQSTVDLGIPSALTSALPSALASRGAGTAAHSQAAQAQQELLSLISGGTHTIQVAADGQDRQRVSSSDAGLDFTVVHNGTSAWSYDGQSNTATHATGLRPDDGGTAPAATANPQQVAQQALQAIGSSSTVSVAGQSKVAGQPVYELVVHPKGTGSTIGEVRIAVDAANGMPLQVRVNPSDGSDSILNVAFATVSFDKPAASTFDYTPPSGAKVVQQTEGAAGSSTAPTTKDRKDIPAPGSHGPLNAKPGSGSGPVSAPGSDVTVTGTGWSTIYSFKPTAGSGASGAKGGVSGELGTVKTLGTAVPGGTLISTKLINVLVADNGTVYAGAVTPALLEQAAGK
ncbi:outer membrane lipoprotein carrier protein LolA [Streptacidiphilus sp. EB129]|uniref:LolA family protein n=1 Tax=Streptacidiphilus sp. EB129 TaxID=3156262 RepID=UPI003515AF45